MLTVCDENMCAGCMLCLDVCRKDAIKIVDNTKSYNAVIDTEKCVNCNLCHNKCPQNHPPKKKTPIRWYQGWNSDAEVRSNAPSGGIGMALAKQFVLDGGYVCSCAFRDGEFIFDVTNSLDKVYEFAGSKYVKSNPKKIYPRILELLKQDQKVLFIGLPCQIAAVKNFVGENYDEKLFTVDLICHGTPSPKLLDSFLNQYSKSLKLINDIKFRIKTKMQVVVDGKGIVCTGVSDKYTIAFLNGLTYTNNCYSCHYAYEDRISDITIGDSWGSTLEAEEIKKGVSLMVVQTGKGDELLKRSGVVLKDVDKENAMANNGQLVAPMRRPETFAGFYEGLEKRSFNRQIFSRYTKDCLKQDLKYLLIKMGLAH